MDFKEKWISQIFIFIFFPVKCIKVIMMAKLKKIGQGPHILLAFLAWYLCPFSDFRPGGTSSKVRWEKQSKISENVCQNLIFRHCRKEQLYSNANLLGNYFLIRIQKVLSFEKSKLLHFLHKLVGMNPKSTHMFRWAWIFREKKKEKKTILLREPQLGDMAG